MHALSLTMKWSRRLSQTSTRTVQRWRRTRWRAAGAFQVIAWVALLIILASSAQQGSWRQAPLLHSRSVVQEVGETIRSMHWRVATTHQPMELRIDAHRHCLHVVAFEGRTRVVEIVERTLWLPEPLKILEAPAVLRITPNQPHEAVTLLFAAPAYSRVFRMTVRPEGRITLREEAAL
jgi:hypothetical protein